MKGYIDLIPPEQMALLVTSIISAIVLVVGSLGAFFKWWLDSYAKRQDAHLEAEIATLKDESRRKDMETQRQLEETQSGRETMRLLFSELQENRKEDSKMRESYERRENAHIEAMSGIARAVQAIEINSASHFAVLKEMAGNLLKHQEYDEIMAIKQDKVIAQNDTTHQRITELSSSLDTVILKVDAVVQGQKADKKTFEDIQATLATIQNGIKHLEDTIKTVPVTVSLPPDSATTIASAISTVSQSVAPEDTPDET